MVIKIAFSNKRLFIDLIVGLFWIVLSVVFYFLRHESLRYIYYIPLSFGVLFLMISVNNYLIKYIEITDVKIRVNVFPSKIIYFHNLLWVNYYHGSYIFRSPDQIVIITISNIHEKDIPTFKTFITALRDKIKEQ